MKLTAWKTLDDTQRVIHGYYRAGTAMPQGLDALMHNIHFLHGTGFSSLCNAAFAEYLPKESNLWFTDAPGHGHSTQPTIKDMPNWPDMADSIVGAIREQAKIKQNGRVVGIGHSMGGVVTLLAAARHPDVFSRIILFDPVLFLPTIVCMQALLRVTGIWTRVPMVKNVTRRRRCWPTQQAMLAELKTKPLYKHWDAKAFSYFIESATKSVEQDNSDASLDPNSEAKELLCNPMWEGSIFGSYPRGLWQAVKQVNVPVDIIIPKNTLSFIPAAVRKAKRINPLIKSHHYTESHTLLGHCFPMEQPKETARIVRSLLESI